MALAIVRLGTPRLPDEGLRIGTVRRPPRGVPKARFAADDWYDVWYPNLSPSPEHMKLALIETARATGGVMLIIMACSAFAWILTWEQVAQDVARFITSFSASPITFLIALNILLLILGMFIEGNAAIIVLVPLLMPTVKLLGIDPIQFGIIMILNLAIGCLTPPMGTVMFIANAIIVVLIMMAITDCIEYGQWRTGRRNTAVTFALQPFINKIAGAVATAIVGATLIVTGINTAATPDDPPPLTPILTAEGLDIPLDYEGMAGAGTMLGTKALQVFDDTTSIVRTTLRFVEFYKHESCGKCTPCREGNWWLVQLLKKFEAGQAQQGDVEKLLDIADDIGGRSFCALADGAVACLTSAIKHFRDEFEQGMHIPAWELFPYERSALFAVREGAHA